MSQQHIPDVDSEVGGSSAVVTPQGLEGNFLAASQKGCLVSHRGDEPWLLAHGAYSADDFGLDPDEVPPEISVDPETHVLSLINVSEAPLSFFITVGHAALVRAGGTSAGTHDESQEDDDGASLVRAGSGDDGLTTFVVVLQPRTTTDLCQLVLDSMDEIDLVSDVREVEPLHSVIDMPFDPAHTYAFPLAGGPFLCSQGFGGEFTHFYPGTYHAVDFECPVGTPVLAIGDGTVVEVVQDNKATGHHVANLFAWNSVMLRLHDGMYAEYVHIHTNSCVVKVGDTVRTGDVICQSGNVGFCPSPHLHLQMHASHAKDAPTVMFALRDADGAAVFPEAGQWYGGGPIIE